MRVCLGFVFGFTLVNLFAFNYTTPSFADDDIKPLATEKDDYDFSWLDPDKKIYVVQNRKYAKAKRLELAINGGLGIGEAYRDRLIVMPRLFYYFNENWGISFLAGFNKNTENQNFGELKTLTSVVPVVRDIQNFYGGSLVWVPFYGKINMFNNIFYLDWHFEAGMGQVSSEIDLNTKNTGTPIINTSSHLSYHWGTGQKFFISRSVAARLDFLSVYYQAPSGRNGLITSEEKFYDNYFLTLGLSYTF